MTIDPHVFRNALGQFPTGVCVVTTPTYDVSCVGVTISSFNSVSLEPPLVLWSLGTSSGLRTIFHANPGFVINVLAADSENIAMRFASSKDRSLTGLKTEHVDNIGARICDSLVSFDCLTHEIVEAGDHDIFIGRVTEVTQWRTDDALGFSGGKFCVIPGVTTQHGPIQLPPFKS